MSRALLYAASYDEHSDLVAKVNNQILKTRAHKDRVAEVPLWRGSGRFRNFVKANFLLRGLPVLSYSLADGLLGSQEEVYVVGNDVSADIVYSMQNYFEIPNDRVVKAVSEDTAFGSPRSFSHTIRQGVGEMDGDEFLFIPADLILNKASKFSDYVLPSSTDILLPVQSKHELYLGFDDSLDAKSFMNRSYQFPLVFDGQPHDCKEPNMQVWRYSKQLDVVSDILFCSRKGARSRVGTLLQTAYRLASQASTPARLARASKHALRGVAQAATDIAKYDSLRVPVESVEAFASEFLDINISLQLQKPDFSDVYDLDSVFDYAALDVLIEQYPTIHPHAQALDSYRIDEFARLQKKHPALRPEMFAKQMNDFLSLVNQPPLLDKRGHVAAGYRKKHSGSLDDLAAPASFTP